MVEGTPSRCWADIDLAALERNVRRIRQALPRGLKYISVVKADAYGHGLNQVATRMMYAGVDMFAVANIEEAAALRELGEGWPILALGPALPEERERFIHDKVTPTLSSLDEVEAFAALAEAHRTQLPVHAKIDTGMGRVGVWHEEARTMIEAIATSPHLLLAGVFTHFASSGSDAAHTEEQRRRFLDCLHDISPVVPSEAIIHADNSGGVENFSTDTPVNAVRVGRLQFGVPGASGSLLADLEVEPVLSFHARVTLTKTLPAGTGIGYGSTYALPADATLAVVSAGYGDGVPLGLTNQGEVLIRGVRCPIRGRVTMDQTIVEVPPGTAAVGDIATFIGEQGAERITVQEVAERAGSIHYEVFCSLTARVKRHYRIALGI